MPEFDRLKPILVNSSSLAKEPSCLIGKVHKGRPNRQLSESVNLNSSTLKPNDNENQQTEKSIISRNTNYGTAPMKNKSPERERQKKILELKSRTKKYKQSVRTGNFNEIRRSQDYSS